MLEWDLWDLGGISIVPRFKFSHPAVAAYDRRCRLSTRSYDSLKYFSVCSSTSVLLFSDKHKNLDSGYFSYAAWVMDYTAGMEKGGHGECGRIQMWKQCLWKTPPHNHPDTLLTLIAMPFREKRLAERVRMREYVDNEERWRSVWHQNVTLDVYILWRLANHMVEK